MTSRRRGFLTEAEDARIAPASSRDVDDLLAQEALDEQDQDRLIAGLEDLHARQRYRNTAVLLSLTACSVVISFVLLLRQALAGLMHVRAVLCLLSVIIGQLPLLGMQSMMSPALSIRMRTGSIAQYVALDTRLLLWYHCVPPVAAYLQHERWVKIAAWTFPLLLTTCTFVVQKDIRELTLTIASLKDRRYNYKGA